MKANNIKDQIIAHLKEVYDPELPVNIYDLGLVYDIQWEATTKTATILITFTTPNCPAAALIPENIKTMLLAIPAVKKVIINITFDPPYTTDRLSEEARLLLGYVK